MPATFPYVDAGQILSVLYFLNIIIFFIWCKCKNLIIRLLIFTSTKTRRIINFK
jgi:hypothetical protein